MGRQGTNPLLDLGFERGEDLAHINLVDFIDPDEYRAEAFDALDGVSKVFPDLVGQVDNFADRWNPNGFMVFPLGVHRRLGSLRLHVYPEADNKGLRGNPEIHSHAWHLASLVLGPGNYSDHMFTLDDEPDHDSRTPYQAYESRRDGNGVDQQTTDGSYVFPKITETRVVKPGQKHFISAGQHHAPIHSTSPISTIVLDSHAFFEATNIVRPVEIDEPVDTQPVEIAEPRLDLTDEDILLAQDILGQVSG